MEPLACLSCLSCLMKKILLNQHYWQGLSNLLLHELYWLRHLLIPKNERPPHLSKELGPPMIGPLMKLRWKECRYVDWHSFGINQWLLVEARPPLPNLQLNESVKAGVMHLSQVDHRLTINIVRDTKARRDIHYSAHTQTTAHGTGVAQSLVSVMTSDMLWHNVTGSISWDIKFVLSTSPIQ